MATIKINLTDAEKALIQTQATEHGMSVSAYCRQELLPSPTLSRSIELAKFAEHIGALQLDFARLVAAPINSSVLFVDDIDAMQNKLDEIAQYCSQLIKQGGVKHGNTGI